MGGRGILLHAAGRGKGQLAARENKKLHVSEDAVGAGGSRELDGGTGPTTQPVRFHMQG
jgi:hypothetical protein